MVYPHSQNLRRRDQQRTTTFGNALNGHSIPETAPGAATTAALIRKFR
jgi:hypothetical protein